MPEISDEELEALKAAQTKYTELSQEFEAVKAKKDELLTEAKRAKNAKREAEEAARQAEMDKAHASKDFEQLFKSSEAEREKTHAELEALRTGIANEKVSNEAMKISSTLAEGTNVDLLADFVKRRLKYAEGEIKVVNQKGELTVSTTEDLAKEFQNDARYAALLKGNQSSGGGANGGTNGGAGKTLTRAEFEALDHLQRPKFLASGGKLTD